MNYKYILIFLTFITFSGVSQISDLNDSLNTDFSNINLKKKKILNTIKLQCYQQFYLD